MLNTREIPHECERFSQRRQRILTTQYLICISETLVLSSYVCVRDSVYRVPWMYLT